MVKVCGAISRDEELQRDEKGKKLVRVLKPYCEQDLRSIEYSRNGA